MSSDRSSFPTHQEIRLLPDVPRLEMTDFLIVIVHWTKLCCLGLSAPLLPHGLSLIFLQELKICLISKTRKLLLFPAMGMDRIPKSGLNHHTRLGITSPADVTKTLGFRSRSHCLQHRKPTLKWVLPRKKALIQCCSWGNGKSISNPSPQLT